MLGRWMRLWGVAGWGQVSREVALILGVALTATLVNHGSWRWLGTAAAVLAMLARRRWPAVALMISGLSTGVAPVLLGYSAGRRVPEMQRLLLAFGAFLAVGVVMTWPSSDPVVTWGAVVFAILLITTMVALPMAIGRNVAQRALLVTALRDRAANLERERRRIVAETRMRERARIAVDMHDTLGHQLTLISLHAGGLTMAASTDTDQAKTATVLHETARRAMSELRGIVGVLNEDAQDQQPREAKGLAAVPELIETARAAGGLVTCTESGAPRQLGARAEHAVYRVLQEGLTNALRHAVGAAVRVRLSFEPDAVIAEVTNSAPAVRGVPGGGQGLVGLRERARLAGGTLHAGPTGDNGFRLAVVLPYDAEVLPDEDRPPTDDGPVSELDVDGLVRALRPRTKVTMAWVITGFAVVIGLGVGLAGAVAFQSGDLVLTQSAYDAMRVGDSEARVLGYVSNPFVQSSHQLAGFADPGTPRCDYFYRAEIGPGTGQNGFRLCFAHGLLTGKSQFKAN